MFKNEDLETANKDLHKDKLILRDKAKLDQATIDELRERTAKLDDVATAKQMQIEQNTRLIAQLQEGMEKAK